MRIAVAGGTGRIGQLASTALEKAGHQAVPVSRSTDVDLYTASGLAGALEGADAVLDVTNTTRQDRGGVVDFFGTVTRNLLAAEERAGVRHHVLLSIVKVDLNEDATPHYAGKAEQERLVSTGPVPWTIVRATQFHDFAAMVAGWSEQDGSAAIAPLLVQPIDMADVAAILAETAVSAPRQVKIDIAGPETQDLVDMARRTFAVRQQAIRLVPTWRGIFGPSMAGEALLPSADARLAPTTFDEWLAAGAY